MPPLTKVATGNFVQAVVPTGLKFDYEEIEQSHRKNIMAAAVEINAHTGRMQDSMLTIGKRLASAKDVLPHGQFQRWVETEFDFTVRTARNFINVFETFGKRPQALNLLSDSALYLLAAPSTPEIAVKEAVKEAKKLDGKMGKSDVQKIISRHQKTPDLHEKTETVSDLEPAEIDAEFTVVSQTETRTHMQWWNELSAADKDARIKALWESEGRP